MGKFMLLTRSPMLHWLFSSCAINLEVRFTYRLYNLWWKSLSTATTTDFCILFDTTIPTTCFICFPEPAVPISDTQLSQYSIMNNKSYSLSTTPNYIAEQALSTQTCFQINLSSVALTPSTFRSNNKGWEEYQQKTVRKKNYK